MSDLEKIVLPIREDLVLRHRPALSKIEIEVTTRCNLMCRHCDRRCSQAPEKVDLSLSEIETFVRESRELNWEWSKICILGGEPTMHPQLHALIDHLGELASENEACEFFMVSNATGAEVQKRLASLRNKIAIEERPKTANEDWFNNMDRAPIDTSRAPRTCAITQVCGLGLTPYGFFPCGAGGAISRALRSDLGIKSLHDVTEEAMVELLRRLCQACGHSNPVTAGQAPASGRFWSQATSAYSERRRLSTRKPNQA